MRDDSYATEGSNRAVRRSGLRRVGLAVVAVAAASTLSIGGAAIFGGPGGGSGSAARPAPPAAHVQTTMVRQTPWTSTDGENYQVARFCDTAHNTTVYVSQAYDQGGIAATGACGSATGSGFRRIQGAQNVDGENYTVAEFCDTGNGTLLYVTEAYEGGGVAAVANGCAPGSPAPGKIIPVSDAQQTDGQNYTIRAYRDAGTGNLLYISEAYDGGGIAVIPGAGNQPAGDLHQLSASGQTDGDNYTATKFCDTRNGALVYVAEAYDGGGVAAVAKGCEAVANGSVPISAEHGDPHLNPAATSTNVDGDNYVVSTLCDADNGNRIYASENYDGGSVAVVPGGCRPAASGLGE